MAQHPMRSGSCKASSRARGKFDEEDMAILNDVFADDVTWHSTGRGAIQQDVHGKEAVLGAWQSVAAQSGDSFRLEPGIIYGDDLPRDRRLPDHGEARRADARHVRGRGLPHDA